MWVDTVVEGIAVEVPTDVVLHCLYVLSCRISCNPMPISAMLIYVSEHAWLSLQISVDRRSKVYVPVP